ncbi:MAG: integrin alpha, partial [bacterium]
MISIFLATSAGAVHLQGEESLDRFGASLSELEDQNGDGFWELLVGAPNYNGNGQDDGRVYLWFGGTELPLAADLVFNGDQNEQFGSAVARIGDVNNDDHADFAVGAPAYQSVPKNGRVYVFFGGPSLDTSPDVIIESPSTTSQFGRAVSAAGDFNGDLIDDLIVGAPFGDLAGADAGEVYVYYGRSSWPGTVSVPSRTFEGEFGGDNFGWSVADAGDFFDNGHDCVVIGAPLSDTHGGMAGGAIFIFEGGTPGSPPDEVVDFVAGSSINPAGSRFGFAVRGIGDWSGDNVPDIAVGAPFHNNSGAEAGRVELFFGGSAPSATADRNFNGQTGGDHFGWSLADIHDVAGTSNDDLLIGAPERDESGSSAGRVYLLAGGATVFSDIPAAGVSPGSLANDNYGYAVSSAGDFDGDLEWDFAVGAENGNDGSLVETGYVHLHDSSDTVTPALLVFWSAEWVRAWAVLLEFALATPPDEMRRLTVERHCRRGDPETGRPITDTRVIYSGAPGAGSLSPEFADGVWSLEDDLGSLPTDAGLTYSLTVELHTGSEVRLESLAGPTAGDQPPAVSRAVLSPARPNPFNPRTSLSFQAPAGAPVACRVFNLRGRCVATLFDGHASGQWQQVSWDGLAGDGEPVAAGLYFAQLE